jgi:hypothetical protein
MRILKCPRCHSEWKQGPLILCCSSDYCRVDYACDSNYTEALSICDFITKNDELYFNWTEQYCCYYVRSIESTIASKLPLLPIDISPKKLQILLALL